MMRQSFGQVFLGLLLVAFDFKLNINSLTIHVLPDFLGYLLIAIATRRLVPQSFRFRPASVFASVMMVLSIVGYFIPGNWMLWAGVTTAFHCLLVWYLLGGIIDVAQQRQRENVVPRATVLRAIYIVLRITLTFLSRYLGPLTGVLSIVNLIVLGMILYLVFQMRREPDLAADV